MTPIFLGQVLPNGKPDVFERGKFYDYCKNFIGKQIEIIVRMHNCTRSAAQQKYYWAVIIQTVAEFQGEADTMNMPGDKKAEQSEEHPAPAQDDMPF